MRALRLGLLLISTAAMTEPAYCVGAYALGQADNGAWTAGTAYNFNTESDASAAALSRCARGWQNGGPNCKVQATFRNTCFAYAIQNSSNGGSTGYGRTVQEAQSSALASCQNMGLPCSVRESFCDTVQEEVGTLICTEPVFTEERRLRATINGDPAVTRQVAAAVNYLRARYCREITGPPPDMVQSTLIGDNCSQESGYYLGDLVYWGSCAD